MKSAQKNPVYKKYSDIIDKFKGPEADLAANLIERYLKEYTIESISDINTLKELIYYEVVQTRFQLKLNDFSDNKSVPIQIVEIMHKNSDVILKLKNSLGLFKDKTKEDGYDALDHLKRRFKVWLTQNQASRTLVCGHCGKMLLLRIRTEAWEAQKHPFFSDKILGNPHLIALYQRNIITKEDVAKVLETSPDYVDWLVTRWGKNQQEVVNGKEEKVVEEVQVEPSIQSNGADSQTGPLPINPPVAPVQ